MWTAVLAVIFVGVVAVVGWILEYDGEGMNGDLHVNWPPLYADWLPHVGPGTPAALTVAVAVVAYGPSVASRLSWRRLAAVTWVVAMAWTWSLALIDGWHRGVANRLTTEHEYLQGIDRFSDIGAALETFTQHILMAADNSWAAHIAGHPPGAVLTFVLLDRIGLEGGGWAGAWCITVGSTATVAILVTVRALAGEGIARRAAPFVVLAPNAVLVGASADGYFAAVAAWGLALLALAATRAVRLPALTALAAGLLFGLLVYLSYGLALMAIPAVAILVYTRTARPLPPVLVGALAVAAAFTLAGFYWWEGYDLLVERYYEGVAEHRPYSYWLWGNLGNAVLMAGLAAVAGVRRAVVGAVGGVRRWRARVGDATGRDALAVFVVAILLVIAVADLSGMSKAETERIWLPFTVWLPAAAALLPSRDHRVWLVAQAVLALALNHLLLTSW
ncbi:hypothetical protein EFW17_18400 [Halostreptopolyspora alba]|uniref:Integral membrane protein n=1 Tax=Halostreptopolyspora alba TaxID=2487137 RepID=A0A3N0E4K3_9ACTN|nr:hypothetical protein EFW17_18400 [Nocardiopsaceae bacterium YIM 96095]